MEVRETQMEVLLFGGSSLAQTESYGEIGRVSAGGHPNFYTGLTRWWLYLRLRYGSVGAFNDGFKRRYVCAES